MRPSTSSSTLLKTDIIRRSYSLSVWTDPRVPYSWKLDNRNGETISLSQTSVRRMPSGDVNYSRALNKKPQVQGSAKKLFIKLNKHAFIFITVSCASSVQITKSYIHTLCSSRSQHADKLSWHFPKYFSNSLPHNLPFLKCHASENARKLVYFTLQQISLKFGIETPNKFTKNRIVPPFYTPWTALTWLPAGPVSEPLSHERQANSSVVVLTDS